MSNGIMFTFKGVTSNLKLSKENKRDFSKIINFFLKEYSLDKFDCEILATKERDNPYYLDKKIYLLPDCENGVWDDDLIYYKKYDFQLAHELVHHVHHLLGKSNGMTKYPPKHPEETEAVATAVYVMEKLLNYKRCTICELIDDKVCGRPNNCKGYNARTRENPDYYDYDKAFSLVDERIA